MLKVSLVALLASAILGGQAFASPNKKCKVVSITVEDLRSGEVKSWPILETDYVAFNLSNLTLRANIADSPVQSDDCLKVEEWNKSTDQYRCVDDSDGKAIDVSTKFLERTVTLIKKTTSQIDTVVADCKL